MESAEFSCLVPTTVRLCESDAFFFILVGFVPDGGGGGGGAVFTDVIGETARLHVW